MPQAPKRRLIDSRPLLIGVAFLVFGCGPLIGIIVADKPGHTGEWSVNPLAISILATIAFVPSLALIIGGILDVVLDHRRRRSE